MCAVDTIGLIRPVGRIGAVVTNEEVENKNATVIDRRYI